MPGIAHDTLLEQMIQEYKERGYKKISDLKFYKYRPDAVVQNEDEIVILEVVDTCDHPTMILPARVGKYTIRVDKRYVNSSKMYNRLLRIEKRSVKTRLVLNGRRQMRWAERPEAIFWKINKCSRCKRMEFVIYRFEDELLCAGCIVNLVPRILG